MTRDPFDELGLRPDATEAEIHDARRRLAKVHHPDAGGDDARMRAVNAAAAEALRAGSSPTGASGHASPSTRESAPESRGSHGPVRSRSEDVHGQVSGVERDMPSFTVEALPVDTFEALLVVAADIADVIDDDPPYRLDVVLQAPLRCWCRLEVVPDAGASTVSLLVGALDDEPRPTAIDVRDLWIAALNALDWPESP